MGRKVALNSRVHVFQLAKLLHELLDGTVASQESVRLQPLLVVGVVKQNLRQLRHLLDAAVQLRQLVVGVANARGMSTASLLVRSHANELENVQRG